MDDKKDIQKTENISRLIDAHTVRTNPFGENRSGERAYRKAERLAAALYLLTNHIPTHESVRARVRAESNELLGKTLGLRDEMRSTQSGALISLQSSVRELISMVRILIVSGFVSLQNANIMIEALDEFGTFITSAQRTALSESVVLNREDLIDVRSIHASRTIKDIKDSVVIKNVSTKTSMQTVSVNVGNAQGHLGLRAQSIIEVLQSGGSLGIKDIASNLPEYSEKMIQRELSELVAQGKVVKAGLKRWSKYSVAHA